LTARRLRAVPPGRINVRLADAHNLPYSNGSIDAVFDFGVLHHLENWRQGLTEIARVLKTRGHFYVEEYFPALYANAIFGKLLAHPREGRFQAAEFHSALSDEHLELMEGFSESRFRLLGVAVKR